MRQRQRWARGGIQILRRHAASLWGRSALSLGQRYHFLAGWLPWLGDALHLRFHDTAPVGEDLRLLLRRRSD